MAIGKVGKNGTLNENGAFYSVQDVNTLLENVGGGGTDLPEPTVADAGSVVVVDAEGKYALGEGGSDLPTPSQSSVGKYLTVNSSHPGEYHYDFNTVNEPLNYPLNITTSGSDGYYDMNITNLNGFSSSQYIQMVNGMRQEGILPFFTFTYTEDDGDSIYTSYFNFTDYECSADSLILSKVKIIDGSGYIIIREYKIYFTNSSARFYKSSFKVDISSN